MKQNSPATIRKLTEVVAVALKKSGEVFTVSELCAALDELKAAAIQIAQEKVA